MTRFAWVKLSTPIHAPNEAPGRWSARDQFSAGDGYEIESDGGPLLLIRGSHGVEVTSITNVVDGRVLEEVKPVAKVRAK